MQATVREREAEEDIFLADDEDEDSQADKFLLFELGEEIYGIAISHITEIIEMQKITEVPDMPTYVKGVINLRGRVIPVMDLRLRFGMEERAHDDRTCIVIVNIDRTSLGFIVDTVAEVQNIREKDIEPPPAFKTEEGRTHFISGLGKIEERVTILIDVERVLQQKELEKIKKNIEGGN